MKNPTIFCSIGKKLFEEVYLLKGKFVFFMSFVYPEKFCFLCIVFCFVQKYRITDREINEYQLACQEFLESDLSRLFEIGFVKNGSINLPFFVSMSPFSTFSAKFRVLQKGTKILNEARSRKFEQQKPPLTKFMKWERQRTNIYSNNWKIHDK